MKIIMTILFSLGFTLLSWAQGSVKLTLSWNESSARYEVYAISNVNLKNYAFGSSQVSLVMPKSAPDLKLDIKSSNGGQWVDTRLLVAPKGFEEFDYHGINTNGGVVDLVANQGLMLFSFVFSDVQCRDGVRLFNNGGDPESSTEGFNGLDFSNKIQGVGNVEIYAGNVANTGSKCGSCPVEFSLPVLKKKML